MKKNILVKILTILIILAICIISFAGIWVKKQGRMENILPDYILGMNLKGNRVAKFVVSEETEEVIYDSEGNISTEGTNEDGSLKEGYTKEYVKINSDDILNEENYEIVKNIMKKRFENIGVSEYTIRLNNQNGEIIIEIPEDSVTDEIISNLTYLGKFEIKDSDTDEVLINNDDVKESSVLYGSTSSGTAVYLNIEFDKEGKDKLENISKTYISTEDEEGNEVTKNVSIELDDESMLETYFDETISTGALQLTIGSASTSNEELTSYINQASQVASLIDSGVMPIHYELEQNNYISVDEISDFEEKVVVIFAVIIMIGLIYWIIKYKLNGINAILAFIGGIALNLIVIRYTNVVIAIESISSMIILMISNYLMLQYALKQFSKKDKNKLEIIKQTYKRYASILCPIGIIAIVFTFINCLPISSIGMVMFWGIVSYTIVNYVIMNILFEVKEERK